MRIVVCIKQVPATTDARIDPETKRIIREAYRRVTRENSVKVGFLIVIAARERATKRKSDDLVPELKLAFEKLGLVTPCTK